MDRTRLISSAKYAGTSVAVGTAITEIMIFIFPNLTPISSSVAALIIFAVNIVLGVTGVISEEK